MLDYQLNMAKITDPQVKETFERFASEIQNKTFAKAYIAVRDCISQKEYCSRIGVNESRFSRVLSKLEKELSSTSAQATA